MKKDDFRFRNFLQTVEKSHYRPMRRAMLDLCKITKSSYYNWIKGVATPSPKRRSVINAIAVKYGYKPVYPYNKISSINIPDYNSYDTQS